MLYILGFPIIVLGFVCESCKLLWQSPRRMLACARQGMALAGMLLAGIALGCWYTGAPVVVPEHAAPLEVQAAPPHSPPVGMHVHEGFSHGSYLHPQTETGNVYRENTILQREHHCVIMYGTDGHQLANVTMHNTTCGGGG